MPYLSLIKLNKNNFYKVNFSNDDKIKSVVYKKILYTTKKIINNEMFTRYAFIENIYN